MIRIDYHRHVVTVGKKQNHKMRPREMEMLRVLKEANGQLVNEETFLKKAWGYDTGQIAALKRTSRLVTTTMRRLRSTLRDLHPQAPKQIVTVPRRGYKLIG